jgi:hypothetical protein
VRRILAAGYSDIAVTPHDIDLDIAIGRGLDNAVKTALMIGPTSRLLSNQAKPFAPPQPPIFAPPLSRTRAAANCCSTPRSGSSRHRIPNRRQPRWHEC